MGDGLDWEDLSPNMGDICGNMCRRNGTKRNMLLLANFPKNARSQNLHGSMRNACMCPYRPILSYICFSVGSKTEFLISQESRAGVSEYYMLVWGSSLRAIL